MGAGSLPRSAVACLQEIALSLKKKDLAYLNVLGTKLTLKGDGVDTFGSQIRPFECTSTAEHSLEKAIELQLSGKNVTVVFRDKSMQMPIRPKTWPSITDLILLRCLEANEEFCMLHASAIKYQGGAILFVGPSMSGKSTIAGFASQSGAELIGDDRAMIDLRRVIIHQLPIPPNFRPSLDPIFDPSMIRSYESEQRPIPVTNVVFLFDPIKEPTLRLQGCEKRGVLHELKVWENMRELVFGEASRIKWQGEIPDFRQRHRFDREPSIELCGAIPSLRLFRIFCSSSSVRNYSDTKLILDFLSNVVCWKLEVGPLDETWKMIQATLG